MRAAHPGGRPGRIRAGRLLGAFFLALALVGVSSVVLADTAEDSVRAVSASSSPTAGKAPRPSPTKAKATATKKAKRTTTVEKIAPQETASRPPAAKSSPSPGEDWEMVPFEVPKNLAPVNDAVIQNSTESTRRIKVCRDWSTSTCRRSSRRGYLAPGENSAVKFKWADTDGFSDGDGWVKQSGCFGCTVVVTAR